jgi:hypothetical protein
MPRSAYTKLTGRNRRLFGHSQLWLGPDHILLVDSTRFAEDYKRFALADIQSIVVTEQPSNIVLQIVMILAALAWMSLWFAVDSKFGKWFFEVSGALALLWPIVDIARGPLCRAFLYTRVSRELLEPVNRINASRRFLATVRPLIEAVQGVLPPQPFYAEIPSVSSEPPPPEIAPSPGYLPEIVFGIFLLNAVLIWASVQFPKAQELAGLLLNTLFVELLLIVIALVRRRGRDPRVIVFVVLGLAIVGIGYDFVTIAGELYGWFTSVQDNAKAGNKSVIFMRLLPSTGYRTIVAISWRAAAGFIGLAASFWERRK